MMDRKIIYNSLFALSWAFLIFINKLALNRGAIPLAYTFQSMLLTLIIISTYALLTQREDFSKIKRQDLPSLFLIGFLVAAAFIVGGTYGLKLTSSINYSLLNKADILFVPLLALIFLKEKISKKTIALMFFFILGGYLIITAGSLLTPQLGDILALIGIFLFSVVAIMQKSLVKRFSPAFVGWVRITFAFLFLAIAIPLLEPHFLEVTHPFLVLLGAVFNCLLAIYINKSLSVSSASYYGMVSMTVPVIVSVLGIFFLGENLLPLQLIGAAIIIACGIIASLWKV
jgi:drug/metabolite transporter (DMT)-like permease